MEARQRGGAHEPAQFLGVSSQNQLPIVETSVAVIHAGALMLHSGALPAASNRAAS
jgi:hypothetical protein